MPPSTPLSTPLHHHHQKITPAHNSLCTVNTRATTTRYILPLLRGLRPCRACHPQYEHVQGHAPPGCSMLTNTTPPYGLDAPPAGHRPTSTNLMPTNNSSTGAGLHLFPPPPLAGQVANRHQNKTASSSGSPFESCGPVTVSLSFVLCYQVLHGPPPHMYWEYSRSAAARWSAHSLASLSLFSRFISSAVRSTHFFQ